jgi:transposase/DNA-binding transcriptional regulator YhcF (GntR family)
MPFEQQYNGKVVKDCIQKYEKIKSFRKVAKLTGVGKSTINRWYLRFSKLAYNIHSINRKKKRKPRRRKFPNIEENVKQLFDCSDLRFISKIDIVKQLDIYQTTPSISTIHNVLKRCNISRRRFQKIGTVCCDKTSETFLEREKAFTRLFSSLNDNEIVCIDESGFSNIGNPIYGYFQKGKQPIAYHNKSRVKRNLVMAISSEDIIDFRISPKPYNSLYFYDFISSLISKLPKTVKYLLMDNVSFHRSKVLKELLEGNNLQILFIPPYSPQYNPIEEVFSDLKRQFRKSLIIEKLRMDQAIEEAIRHLKTKRSTISNHYLSTRKKCNVTY